MRKNTIQTPPAIILCGGKGTRLREVTELLPKPMVPVGDQPIIWHIMKTYAAFGVRRFILCLGYKREAFVDFFMNYHLRTADATITLGHQPQITFHGESEESDWRITLANTGLDTMTGGRIARVLRYLEPEDKEFFLTYGDGLADVDLGELLARHRAGNKLLTLTAVHPEARFGELRLDGDAVCGFEEKPSQGTGYINGGFMVVDRAFAERYIDPEQDDFFERSPLTRGVADGKIGVFRHDGFWQCMDNPREYALLNALWNSGKAPWTKFWK